MNFLNYLICLKVSTTAKPASNCGITNVIKSDTGCFFSKTKISVATGLKSAEIFENKKTTEPKAKPTASAIYFG